MRTTFPVLFIVLLASVIVPSAHAEFRSAKDIQKECRVALKVLSGALPQRSENVLFAGECVGYIQGAVDASQALAENVAWFKVCIPDSVSTTMLIEQFISFVDANPKYTLASTAVSMMLVQNYACKK